MSLAIRLPRPILAWAAAFVWLLAAGAHAAPSFPALTGRVVDGANVLSPQTEADLTQKLQALQDKTGRQLVVVTLPSLQGYEIEDYGYQLGRAWGIGQKGANNGALFIVAPHERKVRVEVGYGLEPVLTDALSSVILQERVLPRFRAGDIQGGVVAGADALIGQLGLPDDQARQNVAQASQAQASAPAHRGFDLGAIIPLILIFLVVSSIFRRRGGGSAWWLLPLFFSGRGGGGWGGGGWSGGGGGGGFSGGGGSFGGGGASGSW